VEKDLGTTRAGLRRFLKKERVTVNAQQRKLHAKYQWFTNMVL
jgi:hypothetical protein